MSLKSVIGMVLAAIVILATFMFFNMMYSIFFGSQIDANTQASFNRLTKEVLAFSTSPGNDASGNPIQDQRPTTLQVPYYISEKYVLVGFSSSRNYIKETCAIDSEIQRPSACRSSACLCVCDRGDLCKKSRQTICKEFPDTVNKIFITQGSPPPSKGGISEDDSQYKNLVIYGKDCDLFQSKSFRTKDLSVERIPLTEPKPNLIFRFS